MNGWPAASWATALLCFIVALAAETWPGSVAREDDRRRRAALLVVMALCGLVMLYTTFFGNAKYVALITLWMVTRRVPYVATERISWMAAAGMVLVAGAMTFQLEGWLEALGVAAVTAAMLSFGVSRSVQELRDGQAQTRLALQNAELLASRELLVENGRIAERLRISRELHDTLGHHLTALSIQLDVAGRRSQGADAENIREAHAITRLLLADVRDSVGKLRSNADLDLAKLIRPFCNDMGDLRIHLEMPEAVLARDGEHAEALVRCVQEIVTNALKHAEARNLWLSVTSDQNFVAIRARDDGQGAQQVTFGRGLTGMRERFSQHGGRVEISSGAAGGFAVHAWLPQSETAS
jgi:signal transduction histidine kinase